MTTDQLREAIAQYAARHMLGVSSVRMLHYWADWVEAHAGTVTTIDGFIRWTQRMEDEIGSSVADTMPMAWFGGDDPDDDIDPTIDVPFDHSGTAGDGDA